MRLERSIANPVRVAQSNLVGSRCLGFKGSNPKFDVLLDAVKDSCNDEKYAEALRRAKELIEKAELELNFEQSEEV